MAQIAKVIDLTRSYVLTDPNSFPENLGYTAAEDNPEKEPPIMAFEGYNFLPTAYGYRSYFGTNSTLDIAALTSRCDEILLYQFANYQNVLIALAEDGLWISRPNVSGNTWTHSITLALPGTGLTLDWTWAVIENKLYLYRQGNTVYYRIDPTGITAGVVTVNTVTPTFLNMAGQMGIFRANGRLGFWDSANSISWSSLFAHDDFIPTAETLAGNSTFNGISGRIVNILPQGDGFVIYATKSIVGVRYSSTANILWEGNCITDVAGITYPFQVSRGLTELEHFAFTSTGIKKIGNYNALQRSHAIEDVLTDTYDYLKESRDPIKMQLINGRYLCLCLIDASYIDGKTAFVFNTIDAIYVPILKNDAIWDGLTPVTDFIAGQAVSSHIASQLTQAVYVGMYLQWNGTGECLVPSRTTAIKPYNQDSSSVHVPNIGLDLTSAISVDAANALVTSGTYADETSSATPYALELGWTYPGLGNVGAAYKGIVDSYLTEMIATQIQEWDNFTTIQTATKTALEAATPIAGSTVQGSIAYFSSAAAQTQIDILVAAGGGSGNSYTVSDTKIGEMLSGAGTTAAAVLTGVGTNYAEYSLTRTLLGGWDVNRRVTRTYSIRAGATLPKFKVTNMSSSNYYRFPGFLIPPNIGDAPSVDGYILGADDLAATQYLVSIAPSLFSSPGGITPPTNGAAFVYYTPIYNGIAAVYYSGYYYCPAGWPTIGSTWPGLTPISSVVAAGTGNYYYIDYVDTSSLSTSVNAIVTQDSTMTAWEENLTWAYIPYGTPPGNYTSNYGAITVVGSGLTSSIVPFEYGITYPGSTHLLQDGALAPIYPDYAGALVLDLGLKKWGKIKATNKCLLDYNPINSLDAVVTYTNFGMDVAMLNAAGAIKLFDAIPTDSWIRYGKIGYYRLGMTKLEEVKVHFRSPSTGSITIDSSYDGRALETALTETNFFTSQGSHTIYLQQIGRWHTVKITGNYDLTYLEVRGNVAGRR